MYLEILGDEEFCACISSSSLSAVSTTLDRVRLYLVNCDSAIWKLSFVYEKVRQTAKIVNLPSILEYCPTKAPRILWVVIVLVNFYSSNSSSS